MSEDDPLGLYERLPAVHRRRDAERGEPLRALVEIVSQEADVVREDVRGLLDDLFVQTADPWVLPYIGDLVGSEALHEVVHGRRADVAKTIYYRRRKGTLPIVEEIARDVTGWGAHAVEFFRLMGWTQNLDHLRYERTANPYGVNPEAFDRVGTVNLRNLDATDRIDGPFDEVAHTADVRPPSPGKGLHSIPRIGVHLWRLTSYPLERVEPEPAEDAESADGDTYGFFFSPLGFDRPLFTNPAAETDPTGLAGERHVPAPIRRLAFAGDVQAYRREDARDGDPESAYVGEHLGSGASLAVLVPDKSGDGSSATDLRAVPAGEILCMDLEGWPRPPQEVRVDGVDFSIEVAVDVERGRMAFPEGKEPDPEALRCSFHYGFPADLGGGPYDRRERIEPSRDRMETGGGDEEEAWRIVVSEDPPADPEVPHRTTVADAFQAWERDAPREAVIEIRDNRTYDPFQSWQKAQIDGRGASLEIRAASGYRPVLRSDQYKHRFEAEAEDTSLTLSGLVFEGREVVVGKRLESVRIVDCTLVPGRRRAPDGAPEKPRLTSLSSEEIAGHCTVTVERSIVGPIRLDAESHDLEIYDSIVDAPEGTDGDRVYAIAGEEVTARCPPPPDEEDGPERGPPLRIEGSTVLGCATVRSIPLASGTIFTEPVRAERIQTGCVRFSYVPQGSRVPRAYRCQPDEAIRERSERGDGAAGSALSEAEKEAIRTRLIPRFTACRYGAPAYAQLDRSTAEGIRTGAENGAEMGVYRHLRQPHREANLRLRLREYLPFGLDEALLYVT